VSLIVTVEVKPPEVPVTVTKAVPVAAVGLAVNVSVLLVVAGFVPNDAVTPLGRPDAESVIVPVNWLDGEMLIALVPALPCVIVRLTGLAVSVKSVGQLFTRLKALTVPMPVAKSHPVTAG
jgi:hypothetical protein